MIAEFLGAAQSVQVLASLLKCAQGLTNYNEIVAAVSEVNAKLMAAQAVGVQSLDAQRTLHDRVRELEQQVEAFTEWKKFAPNMRCRPWVHSNAISCASTSHRQLAINRNTGYAHDATKKRSDTFSTRRATNTPTSARTARHRLVQ